MDLSAKNGIDEKHLKIPPAVTATRQELPPTNTTVSISDLRKICDMKDSHDFEHLRKLTHESYQAFLENGSAADLVAANGFSTLALNCLPEDATCRWHMLVQKWTILQWYYEKTGTRYYLSLALQQCANALGASPRNTQ